MSLTEQEIVRYSRHIILPEVGGRGQQKLKQAAVLVAGLGPSGAAAALYLAAAGVGRLTLWDPGVVTADDLAGTITHEAACIGVPRARSAARPVRAINPDARVDVVERESDVLGWLPEHHVVLASAGVWSDLVPAALRHGGAAVLCGVQGAAGAVAAFVPGSPCLECLGREAAGAAGLAPDATFLPAVAAAAGVVGVMAATETVKLVLGIGEPLVGRVVRYDGWAARFSEEPFGKRPGCPCCGG